MENSMKLKRWILQWKPPFVSRRVYLSETTINNLADIQRILTICCSCKDIPSEDERKFFMDVMDKSGLGVVISDKCFRCSE